MTSREPQPIRMVVQHSKGCCALLLCLLAAWSSANAATVRDNFETRGWDNNDGTVNWSGDWIEVDGDSPPPSPTSGNAQITTGGELQLDDRPNTDGDPGDDVAFSDDAGATYDYEPTPDANGVDTAVNAIRINPKGAFDASSGGGDPSLQLAFQMIVQ